MVWTPLTTKSDGDPITEDLLQKWKDNLDYLKDNLAADRYQYEAKGEIVLNNDVVIEDSRDWRDTFVLIDGYAVFHDYSSQPLITFPSGTSDYYLYPGAYNGILDNSIASKGMYLYTASGAASYSGKPRAEWICKIYFSVTWWLHIWVDSATGFLMAHGLHDGTSYYDRYRYLNAVMTFRPFD